MEPRRIGIAVGIEDFLEHLGLFNLFPVLGELGMGYPMAGAWRERSSSPSDELHVMSAQGRESVSGGKDRPALVATFANAWEADLFQQFLADAGIPAWVDKAGLDSPYRLTAGGMGVVRLFAPLGRVDEARTLLADLEPEPAGEVEESSATGSPVWVIVAGAVLLAAVVISAIPHELRLPVMVLTLAGFLFWWWLPLRSQRRPPDDRPNDANGA